MSPQEWAKLAQQIAGIEFNDTDEAVYTIPSISAQWNGGITLHHRQGAGWSAQYEIRPKPDGAPYDAREVREMLVDLTRTYEIANQLNAITPALEGAIG